MSKQIKLKNILNENSPGYENRSYGSPLPTLEDVQKAYEAKELNEGNSYYDLKKQYYEMADNVEFGGIVSTLQDIKKKKDTDAFEEIGGIDRELRLWSDIQKLFSKSKLGKIL